MDKTSNLKLNSEQKSAIEYGDGPLLIIAGAGTGKTTVITERVKHLIMTGKAKPEEILALTFTEKGAKEMEERIDVALPYGYTQMWVMTFHSFCDRILRDNVIHIGLSPSYKLMTEAQSIDLIKKKLFELDLDYFRPLGNPNKFIDGLLQHFSRLQDELVMPEEYLKFASEEISTELSNAYKKYTDLKIKENVMDFGDLITWTIKLFKDRPNILKIYQEKFKYVLVDEFQDTNYAQNQLAILLAGKNANITAVGDDDQCLPPTSEIALFKGKKEIKDIKIGDQVLTAVGKGHTSLSKVTNIFKNTKIRKLIKFTTEDGKKLTVTNNHKMFCFIPAHDENKDNHFVYLMNKGDMGWRVGVTNNLPSRLRLERGADIIIGIGSFKTDEEARFYEAYYSAKYGLPTIPFLARPGQAISGDWLNKLFNDINTNVNAQRLADDLGIELDSPQFLVEAVTRGSSRRIKINFEMCARNYVSKTNKNGFVGNPTVLHQVSLETSNKNIILDLTKEGIILLKSKNGKRVRKNFAKLDEAWKFAERLRNVTGGIIDKRFKVGKFNYQHLSSRIVPASHIFPGMYIPVLIGKEIIYKKVLSRSEEEKEVETYDLEIEKTHNFIADGIVVHNSIYRFRGAAVSNIVQFRQFFPKTRVIVLTKNYRSTQEILDRSYGLIQHNNPDRLEVVEGINKKLIAISDRRLEKNETRFIHTTTASEEAQEVVKEISELITNGQSLITYHDIAILVRANNHADPFIRELERQGIPNQFLGPSNLFEKEEVMDLISYLKVLYNPEDNESFYRLLSSDIFDISPLELIKISSNAKKKSVSIFEIVLESQNEDIKKILDLINKHLKMLKNSTAGEILYDYITEVGLLQKLVENSEDIKAKNIAKFFEKIKSYEDENPKAGVVAAVDYIDLLIEVGESPNVTDGDWQENNAINILTVHSSKGLEFPVVFLVNLVGERFPGRERHEQIPIPQELIKEVLPEGDFHLQEERRLFYVGMTRAKEKLYFSASDFYGEAKRKKKISPFVVEALGELVISDQPLAIRENLIKPSNKKLIANNYSLPTKINYLSVSQIETFQTCPLHYKLKYIYKLPTKPSASSSFGISIHNTLKEYFESKGDILKIYKNNFIEDGYMNKKHKQEFYKKGEQYLLGFLENGYNPKIKTISLEEKFIVPIDPTLKIGGTIDRVDDLGGGRIEIIDYKTGANIPTQKEVDKDMQLSFYALALSNIKNIKPEDIKLSLYYLDTQEKITTTRSKKDLENLKEEILKIRDEIEASDFKCNNNFFCQGKCEYSMFCKSEK